MLVNLTFYGMQSYPRTDGTFFNSNTGATLATGTNWATEATGALLAISTSFEQKSLCT